MTRIVQQQCLIVVYDNYDKSSAVVEMGDRGHSSVGCHSSA